MTKEELAADVHKILWDHYVSIRYQGWDEEHPYCRACGYLGIQEDSTLHAELVLLEYLEEYYKERFSNDQAR